MTHVDDFLPEPLPAEPFAIFGDWLLKAERDRTQPNPTAMVLATVGEDGTPAARVVLCRQVVADPGYLVFFTNYLSPKGRQLAAHPRAALVFHWDALHLQVRMPWPVLKSPEGESDDYFANRPLAARIGAWASKQSENLTSRAQLAAQVEETQRRFNIDPNAADGFVPRPPHWGGYRFWPESIELWVEGPGRIHDRAAWTRTVRSVDEFTMHGGPWSSTRLNP